MALMSFIQIRVHGCVKRVGQYKLKRPATVGIAIKKAGGFKSVPYPPHGNISVRTRRIRDGVYYCRRRFNFKKNPKLLALSLRNDDMVVVQYHVFEIGGRLFPIRTGLFIHSRKEK